MGPTRYLPGLWRKLETVKDEKKEEKITKDNINKFIRF